MTCYICADPTCIDECRPTITKLDELKSLATENVYVHHWEHKTDDLKHEVNVHKLTELIVQECIDLAKKEQERFYDSGDWDHAQAMNRFQELLSGHFRCSKTTC